MKNYNFKKNQNGVALAIGIILLLIISLIGVTSMKSALLQDKMAAGLKNRELADAAALSLMVEAERWLYNFYAESNGVVLGAESAYIEAPRSSVAKEFRIDRDLTGGFDGLIDINAQFDGILAQNPKFIIESQHDAVSSGSGASFDTVIGEFDGHNAGGGSGAAGADGTEGAGRLLLYRIVTKATDTTGHIISGFESVMSVKVR